MEWFTQKNILPNWAWLVIAVLVVILIVVLVIATLKLREKEKSAQQPEKVEQEKAEIKKQEISEVAATDAKEAEQEEMPEQAEKEQPAAKQSDKKRVYHISKNKDDNNWKVRAEGAARTLKLFKTQAEAIEYAKGLVGNNPEARIIIHKEDGSFRRLTYKSKQ